MQAPSHLSYRAAIAYLQGQGRLGVKLGLERTRALLSALDHPEARLTGALVAGTNGKGSTTAFLESILRAAGHHTGMTPSPHLCSYRERIMIDGCPVSESDFAAAVGSARQAAARVFPELGHPTEFELLIVAALGWFRHRCDRLVIEVGLGGRLDSTNVLDLGVAVITNVGLDHTQLLGTTPAQIAFEKAGIIKPRNLVITGAEGEALEVIERRALDQGAELWRLGQEVRFECRPAGREGSRLDVKGPGFDYRGLRIRMLGQVQGANAALAVAAAHGLEELPPGCVEAGLESARWPGRLELQGDLLLDGGHNPHGLEHVVDDVLALASGRPVVLIFAAMADKDHAAMLAALRRLEPATAIFTRARAAGERGMDPARLATLWGGGMVVEPARGALDRARQLAPPGGLIFACGSLYMIGELRRP